jgi:hypothetical protein
VHRVSATLSEEETSLTLQALGDSARSFHSPRANRIFLAPNAGLALFPNLRSPAHLFAALGP